MEDFDFDFDFVSIPYEILPISIPINRFREGLKEPKRAIYLSFFEWLMEDDRFLKITCLFLFILIVTACFVLVFLIVITLHSLH